MKKLIAVITIAAAVYISFLSCSGAPGDNGTTGPTGAAGTNVMVFQQGLLPDVSYAGAVDADLVSGTSVDTNYSTQINNTVGVSGGGNKYRPVIRFDISSVTPPDINISRATLTIYTNTTMSNTINAYSVTSDWNVSQATWNRRQTAVSWVSTGGDYGTLMDSKYASATTLTFELSPTLVKSWITSPATNYGILFRAVDEVSNGYVNVYSCERTPVNYRPKLTIYYTLP